MKTPTYAEAAQRDELKKISHKCIQGDEYVLDETHHDEIDYEEDHLLHEFFTYS